MIRVSVTGDSNILFVSVPKLLPRTVAAGLAFHAAIVEVETRSTVHVVTAATIQDLSAIIGDGYYGE